MEAAIRDECINWNVFCSRHARDTRRHGFWRGGTGLKKQAQSQDYFQGDQDLKVQPCRERKTPNTKCPRSYEAHNHVGALNLPSGQFYSDRLFPHSNQGVLPTIALSHSREIVLNPPPFCGVMAVNDSGQGIVPPPLFRPPKPFVKT